MSRSFRPGRRLVVAVAAMSMVVAGGIALTPSASGAPGVEAAKKSTPRAYSYGDYTYGNWSSVGAGFSGNSATNGTPSNVVYRLLRNGDDTLVAVGTFTKSGGATVNRVAQFNGTSWVNLAADDSGISPAVPTTYSPNGDFPALYSADLGGDDTLYVAGQFRYADDDTMNNVARWTGSQWKRMGKGLVQDDTQTPLQGVFVGNDPSNTVDTNYADDTVFAVGGITGICGDINNCPDDNVSNNWWGITQYRQSDDTWLRLGQATFNALPLTGAYLDDTTSTDDTVIVAGEFTQLVGTVGGRFNRIAAWSYADDTWHQLGTGNYGFNDKIFAATVHPVTGDLYVAGKFTELCANAACSSFTPISDGVAKWDRGAKEWYSVGSGLSQPNIDDIGFSPDGSVMYVSGFNNTTVGTRLAGGVATLVDGDFSAGATNVGGKWNYLLSAGAIGVSPAAARSLVVNNDGSAYVAGNFTATATTMFGVALFTPGPEPDPNVPATPPGPPRNVVAKGGWQTVTVSWDPPLDQGTYPVTNYLAQATAVGSAPAGNVCITRLTDAKLTECTFTSLKPGVQYTFRVQGLNGGGWGARSEPSNIASPYELKVTGYGRKKLSFLKIPLGSEVSARGTSLGYPAGTRINVFIKEGDSGQWVEQKNSGLTTNAAGTFSWKRKFSKGKDGTPISVQFGIGSDRSNAVRIPPVK